MLIYEIWSFIVWYRLTEHFIFLLTAMIDDNSV